MGSKITFENIKMRTENAEARNATKVFDSACEKIDAAIGTAADTGKRTTEFRLSEEQAKLKDKFVSEYPKFHCKPAHHEDSREMGDYAYDYLKFHW